MKTQGIIFPDPKPATTQHSHNKRLRLGEILIEEKLLTPDQVNDAIEAQQLYGSRLGTSLVELGYTDEDTIAKTLSTKLNLPYMDLDALMIIPQEILDIVPADLARKHQVVPCDYEGKKLYLAMADPLDLAVIDDLTFRLNRIIAPVIVPEIRLMFALSSYYQMQVSPRLRTLGQHLLDKKAQRTQKTASPWLETPDLGPSAAELAAQKKSAILDRALKQQAKKQNKPPEAVQPRPTEQAEPDVTAQSKTAEHNEVNEQLPFSEVCNLLADATDREEIARILLSYLGHKFHCGAILTVKGDLASGWHAILEQQVLCNFNQLTIALDQQSLVRQMVENKHYYLGPPDAAEQDRRLLDCFSSSPPAAILLVPLLIQNRLIGILYAQDHQELLEHGLAEIHQIATKTTMAFEILILRGKILMA